MNRREQLIEKRLTIICKCAVLSLVFVCLTETNGLAIAPHSTTPAKPAVLDINTLEQRFFSRQYQQDPLDKRLQRLELLLFGATQEGGLVERLNRVQEMAARQSHATGAQAAHGRGNARQANESRQIASLERKILKKTFAQEPATKRLARLESQVLGQPTASLSTAERIKRLSKIVGVPEPTDIGQIPNNMRIFGYGQGPSGQFGDDSMVVPFSLNGTADDINRQMNEMIRQMMRDAGQSPHSLRRRHLPPGQTPDFHQFNENMPRNIPQMPFQPAPSSSPNLPPYLDPNSI